MKATKAFSCFLMVIIALGFQQCNAQQAENWTKDQLIAPAALARILDSNKVLPLLYCIGPGAVIPHSIDIGMSSSKNNLNKLRDSLKDVFRSTDIVIYCGCCPFDHCPNVRPAIALLKEMNFTNFHLLDLPHNIKTDWIDKGYPQVKK